MNESENRLSATRRYWDGAAERFDDEPDHGLADPAARRAWTDLLAKLLPGEQANVLDVGCGTGSLSLVAAGLGHRVTGIDVSPEMIRRAEAKTRSAGRNVTFSVMDAANPSLAAGDYNVLMCRHVLWALPEPAAVLERWTRLLAPGGRLVLIEGYWHTNAGLHADQVVSALPPSMTGVVVEYLSDQSELWGGVVADERFAMVAVKPHPA